MDNSKKPPAPVINLDEDEEMKDDHKERRIVSELVDDGRPAMKIRWGNLA